jgi:NADPH-dependent 2,4-dienoyl-CoA reductase/sulfur reductase-like enzyme/peroxiredoxin family protein/rhodanese-related sulfurtransferase/TusA-related sulfurtransferase
MKVLIVGGVAGGATVAARLRRLDEHAEIILFERGSYVSYANCGLPYYIGTTITDRDKLFVQTVKGFKDRFNIDIRVNSKVDSINPAEKTVQVVNLKTGVEYTESYDRLVLSPGAEPVRPKIKGIEDKRVFTLRSIPDTDQIKNYIREKNPKRALVVGGGFIGLEMAENLCDAGLDVCVIEMANQVMAPLDFSMASIVHQHLKSKNVGLLLGEAVDGFSDEETGLNVELRSGKIIETDLVIWSIGVRPETQLAKEAELQIGSVGGIAVNEYLQTSDPDIYALGDAIEVMSPITGKPVLIPLAGPANKQGRMVADNIISGNGQKYTGSIGTAIARIFDLTVASAGVSGKILKKEQIPYISSFTHSASHAGYFPNALPLTIKILFAPETGRLLGAQVVGFDGVDKRIDLLAQVIRNGGTINDLTQIEHAYAPPYSSAKDPVNMAGFVAQNVLQGKVKLIHWRDIQSLDIEKNILLDVRTVEEFSLSHIAGAVNIPVDSLRGRMNELSKEKNIVIYCAVGLRGYLASRILTQNGFEKVQNLSGGYKTYALATDEQNNYNYFLNIHIDSKDEMKDTNISKFCVDACGMQCPGPIIQTKKYYDELKTGQRMEVKATDQAFATDVKAWSNIVGAKLLGVENKSGIVTALIEKAEPTKCTDRASGGDGKTFIVFSDDLDKALASFVIANGAVAMGKKVTMFFTFWGLNVIKKKRHSKVKKDIFGKMFSMMLPSSSRELKLSKLNMGGLGSKMMRYIMKQKQIESLEGLMKQAIDSGQVEMIACTMSMDVMGVKREELLDTVTLGGVASYLERSEQANLNLFI